MGGIACNCRRCCKKTHNMSSTATCLSRKPQGGSTKMFYRDSANSSVKHRLGNFRTPLVWCVHAKRNNQSHHHKQLAAPRKELAGFHCEGLLNPEGTTAESWEHRAPEGLTLLGLRSIGWTGTTWIPSSQRHHQAPHKALQEILPSAPSSQTSGPDHGLSLTSPKNTACTKEKFAPPYVEASTVNQLLSQSPYHYCYGL